MCGDDDGSRLLLPAGDQFGKVDNFFFEQLVFDKFLSSGAVGKLKTSLVSRVIGKLTEFQTWRATRGVPRCDVSSRGRRPPSGVKATSKDKVANRGFVENENSWLMKKGQSKR